MNYDFDTVVIGGGPGGYVCAIRCAQEGHKTALIEANEMGGTCLNRGCIPAKSLLQSAAVYDTVKNAATYGIQTAAPVVDFEKVMTRKNEVVSKLRRGVEGLVRGNGCTLIRGTASFVDAHTIHVEGQDARTVTFERAVIASGSYPSHLKLEGMDSDGFFELKQLPASAVIVGCGVIGIEFATFLNTLGTKVIMFDVLNEILGGVDADIAAALRQKLTAEGIEFHLGEKFDPEQYPAEITVIAAGRRPRTEELCLEKAGVAVNERGFITVDDYCRTNVENIYAIGDVNGKVMLAHAASAQGNAVAEGRKADTTLIPSCVYTRPEIALVGLSEEAAVKKGCDVVVGTFSSAGNGKSMICGESAGFVKMIADRRTHEILGLRLFCEHASDMIGEGIAAIKLESTLEEIADAVHPHPTVNEMIMEAAHDALGKCAHKITRR